MNTELTKKLVNSEYDIFVFEDLKGVRNINHFNKKINGWINQWSFSQLQTFTYYKAEAKGKAKGLAEGEAKGKAEGALEAKREMAKSMLAENIPLAQVAKISGLSESEILNL